MSMQKHHLDLIFGEETAAVTQHHPRTVIPTPLPRYNPPQKPPLVSHTTSRIMMIMILLAGVACIGGGVYVGTKSSTPGFKWQCSGIVTFYVLAVTLLLLANNSSLVMNT